MGTSSFIYIARKSKILSLLSLISGLLALELLLPSVAFASIAATGGYTFGSSLPLDKASVSVVRLVVTYETTTATRANQAVQCTGLGVLVSSAATASTTAGSPQSTNWVLTDGALVNPNEASCLPASSSKSASGTLPALHVSIYASSAYAPGATTTTPFLLANESLTAQGVQCAQAPCSQGMALFSFATAAPQPFLDIATTTSTQLFGIELTNSFATVPIQTDTTGQPDPSLSVIPTPVALPAVSSPVPGAVASLRKEPGMPILDSNGDLQSLQLIASTSSLDLLALKTFVSQHVSATTTGATSNLLHAFWNTGLSDYYAVSPNYREAQQAFQHAAVFNPDFKAATSFGNLAAQKVTTGTSGKSKNGTAASASSPRPIFGIPQSLLIWFEIAVGFLFLILVLLIVSLLFGRARAKHRGQLLPSKAKNENGKLKPDSKEITEEDLDRFRADVEEAKRRAELEVQRQQQARRTAQLTNATTNNRMKMETGEQPTEIYCPHCYHTVKPGDPFCPNCKYVLSPSASGLHLNATPPINAAPPMPEPLVNAAPPVSSEAISQQNTIPQAPAVPVSSISDMPTLEIVPDESNGQDDTTETQLRRFEGHNLSLAVGSLSDPGIKRKHKPNEDSVFAIQGAAMHTEQPQQFGLFVVADGMGGHANGQDASRLAIQTIIDYMLPKLTMSDVMADNDLSKLLVDGVQAANQAVHEHNLRERADTGTTMTAALIVGATAYIANVGDSRTYLYREPDGLRKITHDHSVVASLVEAGIIQPDDVYTHPKRNQIYRSLGEKPIVEVDQFVIPLQPGDKLLLCSDGLWEMVRDPEIQRLLSAPMPDPSKTGSALIEAALDSGGDDNVSVIVVHITEATSQTGVTGIQLLAKPETVTVPNIPQL